MNNAASISIPKGEKELSVKPGPIRGHTFLFARFLSIAVSLFYVLPGQFFGNVGTGLDPSWQLALHEAFDKGRVFGKDFVFTYGPLGWLSTRLPYPSTVLPLLFADILFGILTLWAFVAVTWTLPRWYHLFALPLICCAAGSPFFSHNLVMLMFSLEILFLIIFVRSKRYGLLLPASMLSIGAFCVKLNIGFASIGAIVLAVLLTSVEDRTRIFKGACSSLILLLALITAGYLLRIDFAGYILGSLSIAKGYNDAMPLPPTGREEYVWGALVILGIFSAWLLGNIKNILKKLDTTFAGLVIPLFLFLLFKQAFVRADEHVFEFIAWCSVPIGIMAWAGIDRLRFSSIPIVASLMLTPLLGNEGKISFDYILRRAEGFFSYLAQIERSNEIAQTAPIPSDTTLPREIIEIVGESSVDIFPWEISALLSHKLAYHPRPVPQSYVAYTGYLDGLNKNFFNSSNRPTYIVYAHHCADRRYCNFEDSQTRLSLLSHYDLVGRWNYHLLLKSRSIPRKIETVPGPAGSFAFGRPFKVPDMAGLLFAKINIEHSPVGKIFSTLYQTASIEVIFSSGKARTAAYRIIPPILKAGVILNRLVENVEDAQQFFSLSDNQKVITKLRISSVDPFAYKSSITYSSEEIKFSEPGPLNREVD